MEFALSDTTVIPGNEMHVLTHFLFIKTTEKNHLINCLAAKFSTCRKPLRSLS